MGMVLLLSTHSFPKVHFIGMIIMLKSTVPFKFVQPCKVKASINNKKTTETPVLVSLIHPDETFNFLSHAALVIQFT